MATKGKKQPAKKAKKSTTSKTVKSKAAPKAAKKAAPKPAKITKSLTRTQQVQYISDLTGVNKKDVSKVMECFEPMIASHLKGPGSISFAGLMKVISVKKPATKARKGINPFTGEPTVFKAKPARNIVKIRPLKKVKDLVTA